jgi:regulation of enolase protein 1 (concanavalin A-like superfamily)
MVASFILMGLLSAFPEDGENWKTLAPKGSGFAVELPGEGPQSDTRFVGLGVAGTLHQILIETDDLYCDFKRYELQRPIAKGDEKRWIDYARDQEGGFGAHGKLVAEKEFKLGTIVGREFRFDGGTGKFEAKGRSFVKGSTVYLLMASSRKGGQPLSPDADRFLSSFTFGTKTTTGVADTPARKGLAEWKTVELTGLSRGLKDGATVAMPHQPKPSFGGNLDWPLDNFAYFTRTDETPTADYVATSYFGKDKAPPVGEEAPKALVVARNSAVSDLGTAGKVTSDKPIRTAAGEAREFTMMVDRGRAGLVKARGRTYVTSEGIYVLMAVAKVKGKDLPPEADRFLDSLEIKGRGGEIAVQAGPPAGPATAGESFVPVLRLILGPTKTSLLMGLARIGLSRPMGQPLPGAVARTNPPAAAPSIPKPEAPKSVRPASKSNALKVWGEEIDPDGDVEVVRKPTTLTITIPGKAHVLAPERNKMNAPRVVRPVEGDFTASVLVDGEFRPARGSTVKGLTSRVAGGLILWKDAENYLVFQHRATAGDDDGKNGAVLEEIAANRKGATLRQPVEDGPIFLRLERKKGRIYASFSADGKVWKELKPVDAAWASGTIQVGVVAISTSPGPHTVKFDNLTIEEKGVRNR